MKYFFITVLSLCLFAGMASQASWAYGVENHVTAGGEYFSNTDAVIYPNPFTDQLTVTVRSSSSPVSEIKIYNLIGREILSVKVNAMVPFSQVIDLSALEPGIYFCNLYSEASILQTKKIIKSK